MSKKLIIVLITLIILLVVGGVFFGISYLKQPGDGCIQDAKLCSGGSYVSRTGPNCEFAACPPDKNAGWLTYNYDNAESGFQFKYPESFGAEIWRAFEWPPKASVVLKKEDLIKNGCPNISDGGVAAESSRAILNGISYNLFKISDAAAGSTYTTYCYTTEKDQKYYAIQFVIRYTSGCGESCGPYCGTPQENVCRNFDKVKDAEQPIEQMVSTLKFVN